MQDTSAGLTSAEAAQRLREYGPNVIEEKKRSLLSRFVSWVATPMSLMFVAAGGLSFWAGHDTDAAIVAVLFVVNIGVGAWHEAKADTAVERLKEKLAVVVRVIRDGAWRRVPSAELVPGDRIALGTGDLIPADVTFAMAKNVTVNEAAVTGESLPAEKSTGATSYSGAFMSTGIAEAVVTATGSKTYFGSTMKLVERSGRRSRLERDVLSISKFLSAVSLILMAVLAAVLYAAHQPSVEIASLAVSMLIAGIPVALPTVMTLIISVGVTDLATKAVIVRRLSSLEDLANVDLLLSDKTGTLTENRIAVAKMVPFDATLKDSDIWPLALAAAPSRDANPLDAAIRSKGEDELGFAPVSVSDFIPGDSERKRATAFVTGRDGVKTVTLGASQSLSKLCDMDGPMHASYDALVEDAASQGFRVLVLAASPDEREERMRPMAIFYLADAVRKDAGDTISFMHSHGIGVKMVTGDDRAVASHVAAELGLGGRIVTRDELVQGMDPIRARFDEIGGFAEVLPKDKYDIVSAAQKLAHPHVVAVTGDGVNDVPPVKTADVGIAVANAVDALKGAADIVLTQAGISVIKDAIVEARKIFVRLYNYSVYRISESFRLIITIAVIGSLFHTFPLTPLQIILIALLNDAPIISLAYDRVVVPSSPASINVRKRLTLSLLYGTVGIANSMLMLWVAIAWLHAPWPIVQTLFFLKLTVSGHMLVYVAHTDQPWYKFLPSKQVIWATSLTQAAATLLALLGIFVTRLPWQYVILVWVWSFFWMQVGEGVKRLVGARKTLSAAARS